jgi:hypothetical protein
MTKDEFQEFYNHWMSGIRDPESDRSIIKSSVESLSLYEYAVEVPFTDKTGATYTRIFICHDKNREFERMLVGEPLSVLHQSKLMNIQSADDAFREHHNSMKYHAFVYNRRNECLQTKNYN